MDILKQMLTEHSPNPFTAESDQLEFADVASLEAALLTMAQAVVANAMQPDYLALMRVVLAESPRVPQIASLFRTAVIDQGAAGVATILERAQKQGLVSVPDLQTATRLFVGPLLSYILSDGLFAPEGSSRPPSQEQLAALVRLFVRAIVP